MSKKPKWYLICSAFLPDGNYQFASLERWHEKLRARLVYWLFRSIPKNKQVTRTTVSGTEAKYYHLP